MKRYERLWERLLQLLGTLGDVDASSTDRIRLRLEREQIEIVMTERQWDDLVSIPHGSFLGAAGELVDVILRAQMEQLPFVVYSQYRLVPSPTAVLPQAERSAELRRTTTEALAANPDAKAGWYAYPPGEEPS